MQTGLTLETALAILAYTSIRSKLCACDISSFPSLVIFPVARKVCSSIYYTKYGGNTFCAVPFVSFT